MLTEEEAKAVERLRANDYYMSFVAPTGYAACSAAMNKCKLAEIKDKQIAANAMLRLYPPGWNDPVTPERLVELGGELAQMSEVITFESCAEFWFSACDVRQCHVYDKYRTTWVRIPCYMIPRNMKEARELLVKCEAIKEGPQ